jgi:hypothetical protein
VSGVRATIFYSFPKAKRRRDGLNEGLMVTQFLVVADEVAERRQLGESDMMIESTGFILASRHSSSEASSKSTLKLSKVNAISTVHAGYTVRHNHSHPMIFS